MLGMAAVAEYSPIRSLETVPVLANFGWVLPGRLAGMAYPHQGAGPLLRALGIRAVLTLTESPPEPFLALEGFIVHHEPVTDFEAPSPEALERAVAFVRRHIDRDEPVVVHCRAGIGRTGTALAAVLVSLGREPRAAIDAVRRTRPGSLETSGQESAVLAFARRLAMRRAPNTDSGEDS